MVGGWAVASGGGGGGGELGARKGPLGSVLGSGGKGGGGHGVGDGVTVKKVEEKVVGLAVNGSVAVDETAAAGAAEAGVEEPGPATAVRKDRKEEEGGGGGREERGDEGGGQEEEGIEGEDAYDMLMVRNTPSYTVEVPL